MRANSTKTFFIERCTILVCLILVFSSAKAGTITSAATGNWTVGATWVGGVPPVATDNVVIALGHTVTFNVASDATILDLTVTGTLTQSVGRFLTCNSIVLNGTINGGGNKDLRMGNVAGCTLSGTGTFAMTAANMLLLNSVTIPAGSNLLFNANGDLDINAKTLTNNGTIYYTDPSRVVGASGSVYINNGSMKYHFAGTGFSSNIQLISTAAGNTVEMGCLDAAPWNLDQQNSYYNLIISGSAPMRCQTATTIAGNLTITGSAQLRANGNNISIAGNWTNNSTDSDPFQEGSLTVTFNGSTDQTINTTGGETFYNLVINKSAGNVSLSSPVTVTNILTLTSKNIVTTATNFITMAAGSSVSPAGGSASSFVDGPIAKAGTTAFVFPTGNGTRWARVGIGAPTASTTFRAQYTAAAYTDASTMAESPSPVLTNVSTQEHWVLDRTVGSGNATVTLYWEDANFSGITDCSTSDLRLAHWNGSAWENNNESVTTTGSCGGAFAGTVSTTAAVTSFSPFTFGSKGANALPIELVSFNCSSVQNGIKLEWVTASEINNDYFTIERSSEPGVGSWENAGTVKGAGNSTTTRNYEFMDNLSAPNSELPTLYYRLKQTDRDGKNETFPNTTSCELTNDEQQMLLYPNPTTASSPTYMDVPSELIGKEILVVATDMLGNETYSKVIITNQQWKGIIAIDPSAKLKKGIYLITASSLNKVYKKKLVIE